MTCITDADKDIVALYEYDAWGRTQVQVEDSSLTNEFRFSTKQLNSDSGLVYFGAFNIADIEFTYGI